MQVDTVNLKAIQCLLAGELQDLHVYGVQIPQVDKEAKSGIQEQGIKYFSIEAAKYIGDIKMLYNYRTIDHNYMPYAIKVVNSVEGSVLYSVTHVLTEHKNDQVSLVMHFFEAATTAFKDIPLQELPKLYKNQNQ